MKLPNIVLIIQARMGSTRLPNKMMMDLAGTPLIGRVIERVKRVKLINKIVLAIPETSNDLVLEKVAYKYGIDCYRGNEMDLVDRYYKAALKFNADIILRLPADNPIPEPDEYDRIISYHLQSGNDFSSNICNFLGNGYPDGIGVEIFNFESLEYLYNNINDPFNREHIATNYYDYINQQPAKHTNFIVGTVNCPLPISRTDLVLDINTQEEYDFIRQLFEYLYPENHEFTIMDVINWNDNIYKTNNLKIINNE